MMGNAGRGAITSTSDPLVAEYQMVILVVFLEAIGAAELHSISQLSFQLSEQVFNIVKVQETTL